MLYDPKSYPGADQNVELRFRDRLPFFHSSGFLSEKNVDFQSDAFQYSFQSLQISVPERILIRYGSEYIDQTFFNFLIFRKLVNVLIDDRIDQSLVCHVIAALESTGLEINHRFVLLLKLSYDRSKIITGDRCRTSRDHYIQITVNDFERILDNTS